MCICDEAAKGAVEVDIVESDTTDEGVGLCMVNNRLVVYGWYDGECSCGVEDFVIRYCPVCGKPVFGGGKNE